MKPGGFAAFVRDIADRSGFETKNLMLGGDHLGPLVWKDKPGAEAMKRAKTLVESYVEAGFTKIHIDTSMKLGDDPRGIPLPDEVIAARGAELCAAAEEVHERLRGEKPDIPPPVYVIGSEVPTPGGAHEELDTLTPTSPAAFKASYESFRTAFKKRGLFSALDRIVAFVVQPGVEFNGDTVFGYDREKAAALCASLDDIGKPMFFEGHSSDYQMPESLAMMVRDGIGILKVGPGLTFALREGLMALEHIERELAASYGFAPANFADTLEDVMRADDSSWKNHYRGDAESLRLQRRYSFFDRARYYLPHPEVDRAIKTLLNNLERAEIGLTLLSQYLPHSYEKARRGTLPLSGRSILKDCVREALSPYFDACGGDGR
jgi:D-tagatose-1,6-bisphosphate aldolase subunit GatZ/KbaZ